MLVWFRAIPAPPKVHALGVGGYLLRCAPNIFPSPMTWIGDSPSCNVWPLVEATTFGFLTSGGHKRPVLHMSRSWLKHSGISFSPATLFGSVNSEYALRFFSSSKTPWKPKQPNHVTLRLATSRGTIGHTARKMSLAPSWATHAREGKSIH